MTAASYDGDGLRATATYGASTQDFVWNNVSTLPQVLMDSGNAYIYTSTNLRRASSCRWTRL